jgi:hypothetical protein
MTCCMSNDARRGGAGHAKPVQDWLAEHKEEIQLSYLPAYAPEHNLDEYLNNDLKQTIKN